MFFQNWHTALYFTARTWKKKLQIRNLCTWYAQIKIVGGMLRPCCTLVLVCKTLVWPLSRFDKMRSVCTYWLCLIVTMATIKNAIKNTMKRTNLYFTPGVPPNTLLYKLLESFGCRYQVVNSWINNLWNSVKTDSSKNDGLRKGFRLKNWLNLRKNDN